MYEEGFSLSQFSSRWMDCVPVGMFSTGTALRYIICLWKNIRWVATINTASHYLARQLPAIANVTVYCLGWGWRVYAHGSSIVIWMKLRACPQACNSPCMWNAESMSEAVHTAVLPVGFSSVKYWHFRYWYRWKKKRWKNNNIKEQGECKCESFEDLLNHIQQGTYSGCRGPQRNRASMGWRNERIITRQPNTGWAPCKQHTATITVTDINLSHWELLKHLGQMAKKHVWGQYVRKSSRK